MSDYKQGDKVFCNGFNGTIVREYSQGMYEVRLPGGLGCIDSSDIIPVITEKEYNAIHSDYRSLCQNEKYPDDLGKRSCFAGCLYPSGGTTTIVEGSGFMINN
jgi:hypothetical protein